MPKFKKSNMTRINVNVHDGLYQRIKEMSEITGQTYSSVMQMALAVGVGQLEPAILGSVRHTQVVDTNAQMLEVFKHFAEDFTEAKESIESIEKNEKLGYEQEELKLNEEEEK